MKRRSFLGLVGAAAAALVLELKPLPVPATVAKTASKMEFTPGITDAESFRELFDKRLNFMQEAFMDHWERAPSMGEIDRLFESATPSPDWRYGKWKEIHDRRGKTRP